MSEAENLHNKLIKNNAQNKSSINHLENDMKLVRNELYSLNEKVDNISGSLKELKGARKSIKLVICVLIIPILLESPEAFEKITKTFFNDVVKKE